MILVYFVGYGEWFFHDGKSLKLAITRTTKEPYKDPRQYERIDTYCPDYDEWLGLDEDNEENFSEWVKLFESSRNSSSIPLDDQPGFKSKELEYDHDLQGIFIRDPDVKGDVFDTDGLRCRGPNYIECQPEIEGVFRLTDKDERRFRRANFPPINNHEAFNRQWNEFAKTIETLLPCSHPNSYFLKQVEEGKLSVNDADKVFWGIQSKQFHDFFGRTEPTVRNNFLYLEPVEEWQDQEKTAAIEARRLKTNKSGVDINKLAEISLGMAMDKYGYDPDNPKKIVFANITKNFHSYGISLELDDTQKCLAYGFKVHKEKGLRKFIRDIKPNPDTELDKLLRLFIGMSIDAYDYDPLKSGRQKASGSAGQKGSIAEGISNHSKYPIKKVSKGTVKKYLDEAKILLLPQCQ